MRRSFISLFFVISFAVVGSTIAVGQIDQQPASGQVADTTIPRNSRIYIEPMDGFETYFATYLRRARVPLVVVTESEQADFIVRIEAEKKNVGWVDSTVARDGQGSEMIRIVNVKTGVVVYRVLSYGTRSNRVDRRMSEKLAENLKKKIENDEKKARKNK